MSIALYYSNEKTLHPVMFNLQVDGESVEPRWAQVFRAHALERCDEIWVLSDVEEFHQNRIIEAYTDVGIDVEIIDVSGVDEPGQEEDAEPEAEVEAVADYPQEPVAKAKPAVDEAAEKERLIAEIKKMDPAAKVDKRMSVANLQSVFYDLANSDADAEPEDGNEVPN